jgi:hypothetical protein
VTQSEPIKCNESICKDSDKNSQFLLLEGGWKHVGLETVGSLLKLRGEVMSENGVNTQEVEPEWGERNQILMTSFEPLS